jgi:invasion protein IalB
MKVNNKQITFAALGLALITVILASSIHFNIASAAKEDGKTFGNWKVFCQKNLQGDKKEMCLLTQTLNVVNNETKEQQEFAIFQFGYWGDKKELKMVQSLPLGISIQAGTSLVSEKKLLAPGQYQTCISTKCNAVAAISDQDLNTILSGKENAVIFMSYNGKSISLPLDINGLKEGLDYIK